LNIFFLKRLGYFRLKKPTWIGREYLRLEKHRKKGLDFFLVLLSLTLRIGVVHEDILELYMKTFYMLACFASMLLLSACGPHHYNQTSESIVGRESFFDEETTKPSGIRISDVHTEGRSLMLLIQQEMSTQEVDAEKFKTAYSSGVTPDPVTATLALTFDLLFLDTDSLQNDVLGTHYSSEDVAYRDKKPTGKVKTTTESFAEKPVTIQLELDMVPAYDPSINLSQSFILEENTSSNSSVSIPIAMYLEHSEERLSSAGYNLRVSSKGFDDVFSGNLSAAEIAGMQLENPIWAEKDEDRRLQTLPIDEQRAIYRDELLSALKADDYRSAVRNFHRLETLEVNLPISLDYYYAKALFNLGETDQAREKFTHYLAVAGQEGRFVQQAQEYLNDLQ